MVPSMQTNKPFSNHILPDIKLTHQNKSETINKMMTGGHITRKSTRLTHHESIRGPFEKVVMVNKKD